MIESNATFEVRLVDCAKDTTPPDSPSEYSDWGAIDTRSAHPDMERWLIVVDDVADVADDGHDGHDGGQVTVGDLTAMPTWFGPTTGSLAVSIGIALVPQYRGRGIGTTAQRLLAELLHNRGIVRVQASTDVTNIAEQRALAKAGFTFEGVMRGAQVRASGRHDLQVWSHLRGDGWFDD